MSKNCRIQKCLSGSASLEPKSNNSDPEALNKAQKAILLRTLSLILARSFL